MGAWGAGLFDNDDAADWLAELEEADTVDLLRTAFEAVIELASDEYLEAPQASAAIAAAEVVAAAFGAPSASAPPGLLEWVEGHRSDVDEAIRRDAARAVSRVERQSELRDLWSDADDGPRWFDAVADLRNRLSKARRSPSGAPRSPRKPSALYRAEPGDVFAVPLDSERCGYVKILKCSSLAVLPLITRARQANLDVLSKLEPRLFYEFLAPYDDPVVLQKLGRVELGADEEFPPPRYDPPDLFQSYPRIIERGHYRRATDAEIAGLQQRETMTPSTLRDLLEQKAAEYEQ